MHAKARVPLRSDVLPNSAELERKVEPVNSSSGYTEPGGPVWAAGAAHVDGEIVPIDQAKISVLDAGVTRSDITYDVVAVWEGSFFRLDDHLDRFERSCAELRMTLPLDRATMVGVLDTLVRTTGLRESYVEMVCSRGVPRWGSRDPREYENRFYAFAVPYLWISGRDDTMDAVIARTVRRIPSDSVNPTVKNFHWGDLTRGQFEAYDRGARHTILLDHQGNVTEGPGYNIFALVDDTLLTPSSGVLKGITRKAVLHHAEELGIPVRVGIVPEEYLGRADELFATSTAGGIMPITSLDGRTIGDGAAGPVTQSLLDAYWAAHSGPKFTTPIDYNRELL